MTFWRRASRSEQQHSSTPPLPEPDLASRDRARNANRLVEVAGELERVADIAAGKVIRPEMNDPREAAWLLRLAAPSRHAKPAAAIVRWLDLFSDELNTVWRARNNVTWGEWISDGNVAAAAQMAERLLHLARAASEVDEPLTS